MLTNVYEASSCGRFPLIFFVLLLSEKETERAEGELGTMDSLSPRATHNCCQVWTATQQPIHHPALYSCSYCTIIVFYVILL